jgi:hypothetical protein
LIKQLNRVLSFATAYCQRAVMCASGIRVGAQSLGRSPFVAELEEKLTNLEVAS